MPSPCLAHNQDVFGFFVCCKLLVLKELVGANGFEPSTSWSRTRRASQAALRPDCLDLTTASESSDEGHRPSRSDSGRASQAALRPDRHAWVYAPAPSATIRLTQLRG